MDMAGVRFVKRLMSPRYPLARILPSPPSVVPVPEETVVQRGQFAALASQDHPGVCVVCDTRTRIHYDARFDAEVCDVCDAMLTIRDDEFRRAHPEHDQVIRSIWRERGNPANARAIGLRYYDVGYWDEQDDDAEGFILPGSAENITGLS